MNSLKFEGTVNGQKFNSVTQYNDALKAALEAGGEVKASSRTYTENVPEPEEKPTLFPGFAHCIDELNLDSKFLTDTKDMLLEKIRENNQEFLTGLKEALAQMDAEQTKTYLQKAARIKAYLGQLIKKQKELSSSINDAILDNSKKADKNYSAVDTAIGNLDTLFGRAFPASEDFNKVRKELSVINNALHAEETVRKNIKAGIAERDIVAREYDVTVEFGRLYDDIIRKVNNHLATIDPTWMMGGVTCTDSECPGETQTPASEQPEQSNQASKQVKTFDSFFDELDDLIESIFG